MKTKQTLLAGIAVLALPAAVHAQLHIDGGGFHIAAGAVVAVRGDVTSNGTSITGDGTLLLNGTSAQNLGMGGGNIPVLEVNNANNVVLTSAARIEDQLTLTAGNVLLGNNNLTFDPSAFAMGAATGRVLVTNGTGFVKKEDLAQNVPFAFPVGQAAGDLTQAILTNTTSSLRDYSVQVKDYSASVATEGNAANGVNRTWQIFADQDVSTNVALQHNASSTIASFDPNDAFVTRQTAAGAWTLGMGEAAQNPPLTHDSVLSVPALADATSYFSKSDDELNSLNPTGFVAVKVFLQGNMNGSSASMRNDLQTAAVLPTTDPYGLGASYAAINNPSGPAGAVSDWVRVQVRDAANPSIVYQQRALLLKTDGTIVDVNGATPGFTPRTSQVRFVVFHRNHLNVMSQNTTTPPADNTNTSYDFTVSASSAFKFQSSDPEPQIAVNGVFAMYAGDLNANSIINTTDRNIANSEILSGVAPGYNLSDVNMNTISNTTDRNAVNSNVVNGIVSPTQNY